MARAANTVVIGAGVIGLMIARELAIRGHKVLVLDRGVAGGEASWAGGGLLAPINPQAYPQALLQLAAQSAALYPGLARALSAETGIDVELLHTGLLRVIFDDEAQSSQSAESWRAHAGTPLDGNGARAIEPELSPAVARALHQPEILQVRNPRLLKALIASCRRHGVEIGEHESVERIARQSGSGLVARTALREIATDKVVLAAGAWSRELSGSLGCNLEVRPVHGAMLLFAPGECALSTIVVAGERYLIPRADGYILAGSSMEERGFDKEVSPATHASIQASAIAMAPRLAGATLSRSWAGLRPATPDRMPYLGRAPEFEGVFIATGHFRNGLLLAPITAQIASDLIEGRKPSLDLAPFAPDRVIGLQERASNV